MEGEGRGDDILCKKVRRRGKECRYNLVIGSTKPEDAAYALDVTEEGSKGMEEVDYRNNTHMLRRVRLVDEENRGGGGERE